MTISNIGVVMFTVSDQDAAIAFYTDKLGFELRGDTPYGENNENRWVEVAPPGSTARLALNPPMNAQPGGGDVDVDPEPMQPPGAPLMFMMRDPDGNHIAVVERPAGA